MDNSEKYSNLGIKKKIIHSVWSIISKTPIQKKILLKIGIRNVIDFADKHGYFDIYQKFNERYWNELPLVLEYINKNITGNKNIIWQKDILTRFKENLPFKKVLIIGCGNGWVERELYDLGIGLDFDAFDISNKFLNIARKKVGNRKISYFVADLNKLKLKENNYDAVFNVSVLHHIENISDALRNISKVLKPNGLIFNYEYVGPNQYQYSNEHLKILNEINKSMPERFQTKQSLRPLVEDFELGDNTEAINSELIYNEFNQFFDIIYDKEIMGGIAYPILWNNIEEFQKNDEESKRILNQILVKDNEYTKSEKIPNLHSYFVAKSRK